VKTDPRVSEIICRRWVSCNYPHTLYKGGKRGCVVYGGLHVSNVVYSVSFIIWYN